MALVSFFGSNNENTSPSFAYPENLYSDDGNNASGDIGPFVNAVRYTYITTFDMIGSANGQIPLGSTINSVNLYGQGRTTGAGSVGVQAYVDGALKQSAATTSSSIYSPQPIFSTGAMPYITGSTPWTTDDLDNTSFKSYCYYTKTVGIGSYYGFIDYTKAEVDYNAASAINMDASSTATGTTSSYSGSHSTGGANRGLLVVIYTNSASTTFSTVTYNAVVMNQESIVQAQGYTVAIYSLIAPATGSNTLAVTFGQSNTYRIIFQPLTGVNQTKMVEAANTGNGNASTADITLEVATHSSFVFNATIQTTNNFATDYMVEKAGQGIVSTFDQGNWITGLSYKIAWAAGSVSTGWFFDISTTGVWAGVAVAVKPAAMMVENISSISNISSIAF